MSIDVIPWEKGGIKSKKSRDCHESGKKAGWNARNVIMTHVSWEKGGTIIERPPYLLANKNKKSDECHVTIAYSINTTVLG